MLQHFDSATKDCRGKTITSVTRKSDSTVIITFTEGGGVQIDVDGDCCSSSIFYAIDGIDSVIGQIITAVDRDLEGAETEDIALARASQYDEGWASGTDSLSVWDVVFYCSNSAALRLRHINDSNGYYDGYVTFNYV